ncbi:conserved Plasmodium protein, unknown function [Plasmodium chabaudi chabaudi]|uniref:Uncharacterized protein n=1 Tax=Plasmodium chabaudi chabaudi TaxID=31271 RepID=A0A1D3RUJ3_PLACU|nr:conserved Plasmodium protein, unknown function [Plasmodium chabaudi chabaudi]
MGNCVSYSSHFDVYKTNKNEYYENLICNFVKGDKHSLVQKAFIIYEFLRKKSENKDEYLYYITNNTQRKKVKSALVKLGEDKDIDFFNFLLKLYKKMNNDYYKNINDFNYTHYYNMFLHENSKFSNFPDQINIIQKIYNFIRIKYILENICLHVYFEKYGRYNKPYEINNNFENKVLNNNELVKDNDKSLELLNLKKNTMNIMSTERRKMLKSIRSNFKKIENISTNNIQQPIVFDRFKMSNEICLYILNNNYKIKCILYNIFIVLYFLNKYCNMFTIDDDTKDILKGEVKDEIKNERSKNKCLNKDKIIYTLEHGNVYMCYLFISLCLCFDKKIEEDILFNHNINLNQENLCFSKCISEFLDLCRISCNKSNKFSSYEIKKKEKNIYHCSLKSIQNVGINDSLINSYFICQNKFLKSIINIGNSNYFINDSMIVFCFILFGNINYISAHSNGKKRNGNHYNPKLFSKINSNDMFGSENIIRKKKKRKRILKKLWNKFLRNKNSIHNKNYKNGDGNNSINDDIINSMYYVDFNLNNIGLFKINLYNLNIESMQNGDKHIENSIELYTIQKQKDGSHVYVKKEIDNKTDNQLLQNVKSNSVDITNVLRTMRNKEMCYIFPVNCCENLYDKIKKKNSKKYGTTTTTMNDNFVEKENKERLIKVKDVDSEFKNESEYSNQIKINYAKNQKNAPTNYINEENGDNNVKNVNTKNYAHKKEKNKIREPFFIHVYDTFVPFEMEQLILKYKNFCDKDEEIIKTKPPKYKQVHKHGNINSALYGDDKIYERKNIKKNIKMCTEKNIDNYDNINLKKEHNEYYKNKKCINNKLHSNILREIEANFKDDIIAKNIFKKYNKTSNDSDVDLFINKMYNIIKKNSHKIDNENSDKNKCLPFMKKVESLKNEQKEENYNNIKKNEKREKANDKQKRLDNEEEKSNNNNRKEYHLNNELKDIEHDENKINNNKDTIDTLKIFIQHKSIDNISYFVNNADIEISFDLFKICKIEKKKKLIFSTYVNSDQSDRNNMGRVNYKITLDKNDKLKYMIDLLFLHLNYNRLYYIYIPNRLLNVSDTKFENNFFLNLILCNDDIIIENLCITPASANTKLPIDKYICSIYFDKNCFIKIVLFMLVNLIKIYNNIKKAQYYFEEKCNEFITNFYDYFNTKINKLNYNFYKKKKKKKLFIKNVFFKKKHNVKKSEHQITTNNGLCVSLKNYSKYSDKYISTEEDNNVDKKSIIINVSSTLNSDNCTNNMNNTNNAHSNNNDEHSNNFNCYLNQINNEKFFDIGYKYKNIYIKIIDIKLYECIVEYIDYIRENNSYYYLCPYIVVKKFKGVCFLFIPVCKNFYLIFNLFFFHFLNCSNFFNFKRCFSMSINNEDNTKVNFNLPSTNNFLHINNLIKILDIYKIDRNIYVKYIPLYKGVIQKNNNNPVRYYKWKKKQIIIDIRNSFSSPYFIHTKSFVNFIENTNLNVTLKRLYLNKDDTFYFKIDKKNSFSGDIYSNGNNVVFMFNYYFHIYTYHNDEKYIASNKELFRYNKYIIVPYFNDIYIHSENLLKYVKIIKYFESRRNELNENTNVNEDSKERGSNSCINIDDVIKEDKTVTFRSFYIQNLYKTCDDLFINYFYLLLNNLVIELVNEMKLNNFLSILNVLQLLKKYNMSIDMYFWTLYDNYINVYNKYCAHAQLVKLFNNNNPNEVYNFDFLKNINYNYCNKKKFYIKRIVIFSACILISSICKHIIQFFVSNFNFNYEIVFSTICLFLFTDHNNRRNLSDDHMYLNIQKSIYFNIFFSLSYVLQYIPLNVQYLNLYKIINKVKKYKTILAICLNYICETKLPFYAFWQHHYIPIRLLKNFFSFNKKMNMICRESYELNNIVDDNRFEESYYNERNFKINKKENMKWVNEKYGYNVPNNYSNLFKNKKMVKNAIYKHFQGENGKNKCWNIIYYIIKMNFNSNLNTFEFCDLKNAHNNILSYFTNINIHALQLINNNDDIFQLIYLHFVNFISMCWDEDRVLNDNMSSSGKVTPNEMTNNNGINNVLSISEKTNGYLKMNNTLIKYYSGLNLNAHFLFANEYNFIDNIVFNVLLEILETYYTHLLDILPIFKKKHFKMLTYDLKIYLINIFFYIFVTTDKYKIHDINNKDNFSKLYKHEFMKQKYNMLQFDKNTDILNKSKLNDFFVENEQYISPQNYFEILKNKNDEYGINSYNNKDNIHEYCNFGETGNEIEFESENKTHSECEIETQSGSETYLETENNKNLKEDIIDKNEKSTPNKYKQNIKIVLLDNDYNIYIIEFFFKLILRIIPFFKLKDKHKDQNVMLKSTIIYNIKIILASLTSFKNIILSMKNNFYMFIYYFFIKGYISLILLNVNSAIKNFKKVFALIVFFFGNPIDSINTHPFLIYVTYILYVLTILSKLNLTNFFEDVHKNETEIFSEDILKKVFPCDSYSGDNNSTGCDNTKRENMNHTSSDNNSYQNDRTKENDINISTPKNVGENNNYEKVESSKEKKNKKKNTNDKKYINNVWMKQKYEIWMYLEIIRTIKRNYIKFNNNIYLVPLNYFFINLKKNLKKYLDEKENNIFDKACNNDDKVKDNNLKKSGDPNIIKKKKNDDKYTTKEISINNRIKDKNMLININNNFIALYPNCENVSIPKLYIKGEINKSVPSMENIDNFEKDIAYYNKKMDKETKNIDQIKYQHEEDENICKEQKGQKKNISTSTNLNNSVKNDNVKYKYNKILYGSVDKKDICNILLYNIIYINKMNRKINNCKFACFNFKYYTYNRIISDYNNYYNKVILKSFKSKLCENYYAYTFGNNENGALAIGKPSYLKLSPTIGEMGYEENKTSVKKGTDFWFTNSLQFLPMKIKKICVNGNMISIIDDKHNLYICGKNSLIETKNELYIKDKHMKLKDENENSLKNGVIEKIPFDKFFTNLKLNKIKKEKSNLLDYNSSSGDSDDLLLENSSIKCETTVCVNPKCYCDELTTYYENRKHKNSKYNYCTYCASLYDAYNNLSSCDSDICSSSDSGNSDSTYIKVNNLDEINKNININLLLNNNKDKSFFVKKKNDILKKVSIEDFNIYNTILYSSSYANQYLAYVLPDQKYSKKFMKKYFNKISIKNHKQRASSKLESKIPESIDNSNYNNKHNEYKKNIKESSNKTSLKKGKYKKVTIDNNINNNKFIYNFIHDIKTRIKFVDIYNGSDFVISINNFGHVYSWGNNKYGCLGTGDNINRYAPTLINPGHFFLYDFEKLQIHTNYKTEVKVKNNDEVNNKCSDNILYNSLILETIKKYIYNKNKDSMNNLKAPNEKSNKAEEKSMNSNNFVNTNKYKDEDLFTLKTNNLYSSNNMFNFKNLEVKNVVISVHKIYVPISSIFCGDNHVCAFSNGSIFMWGEQKLGQTSIPFENIYFDCFNKSDILDSETNDSCKQNISDKKNTKINKTQRDTISSFSSSSENSSVTDKNKYFKNSFTKNIAFKKKTLSSNVDNPIHNVFSLTNNEVFLNNNKIHLSSNLNSMNSIKRAKNNNNLVLCPIQVCLFNLSYRVKKVERNSERNSNSKLSNKDTIKNKNNLQKLMDSDNNLKDFENCDSNNSIDKTTKKKLETNADMENTNAKKPSYIRIYDYLETFIKAEIVNIYMNLFRNDINIYTNIPNNSNINPYIYGMKFYDYNFYDNNYTNVQDYYDIKVNKNKYKSSNNFYSSGNNKHKESNRKLIDETKNESLNHEKNGDILNASDPNKFIKLMKEDEMIDPQIYEYIEKEETVCINIKLIIFLFLFIKKKYMIIFLNSILMVSNVSCGEANTVITCFKKSIYDKYYQYIMKNITCIDNYKHLESEKLKSKTNTNLPEHSASLSETCDNIYRNDIFDIKNYTGAIIGWGDKSFDEFKVMNSTYSCSDTSCLYRMIEEILAHYMCIYVCGRDTNNNLCLNNINDSIYTFTRISNNFFNYNFNNFLCMYKYNYYLYYIHQNNVHINHNNDVSYIHNNPLTSFKNKFNIFATRESNNGSEENTRDQNNFTNKFIIIKKIVCSNIVTCLLDIHNNIYIAGDLKYYFPNYFHHIAYGLSPFVKINLNNPKTIKNISISQNNIFLIYDDHSVKILGYNNYIDFFKHHHPIFFTNKHNQKHSYKSLTIQNSDFLVKDVQTGSNCTVFVMKRKKGKKNQKKITI